MEKEMQRSQAPRNIVAIFDMHEGRRQKPTKEEILARFAEFPGVRNRVVSSSSGDVTSVDVVHDGTSYKFNVFAGENASRLSFTPSREIKLTSDKSRANNPFIHTLAMDLRGIPATVDILVALKAAELIAIHYDKATLSVSLDVPLQKNANYAALFESGMRLTYAHTERSLVVFEKSLRRKHMPSDGVMQQNKLANGATPIITGNMLLDPAIPEVAIPAGHISKMQRATLLGYVGTGFHVRETVPYVYFQKAITESRLALPVLVNSEWQRLSEVIVSITPPIKGQGYPNNEVSKAAETITDRIAYIKQHRDFVEALRDNGVKVTFSNGYSNEAGKAGIFTRDPGFAIGNVFVIGKMAMENRAYEAEGIEKVVRDFVKISGKGSLIEGGDVTLLNESTVVVGIGARTNLEGFYELADKFKSYLFVGVKHDELHLDVLFTLVGKRKALADTGRLPPKFLHWLKTEMQFRVIEADPKEQISLGCNVVAIDNNKVIAAEGNTKTKGRLVEEGVEVIEVNMPDLIKGGGGPRCMTCPVNRNDFELRKDN